MSLKSPFTTKIERGGYSAIVFKDGDYVVAEDNVGTVIKEDTDAATAIQAAIDALTSGGELFIKRAETDYIIVPSGGRGLLVETDNVKITSDKAVLKWDSSAALQDHLLEASKCSNIEIQGLVFDGNKSNVTDWTILIQLHRDDGTLFENFIVQNCIFKNQKGDAFFSYVEKVVVKDCSFEAEDTGVVFGGKNNGGEGKISRDCIAIGNVFRNCGTGLDSSNDGDRILFANNSIYNSDSHGIRTCYTVNGTRSPNYVTIIGNVINGWGSASGLGGIALTDGSGLNYTIIGNIIKGPGKYGIFGSNEKGLTITGNVIEGCDYAGIYLVSDFGIAKGNIVKNNSQGVADNVAGIIISANNCLIEGNTVIDDQGTKTQYRHIQEASGKNHNVIKNNNVNTDTAGGARILITGSDTKLLCNYGYKTEAIVLSSTFAIDSTGVKTVTIAHGLDKTPAKEDCYLTVVEETDVDDWRFDLLKVDSVDGTNVTAKIHVSTASATGSATAKLALRVGKL